MSARHTEMWFCEAAAKAYLIGLAQFWAGLPTWAAAIAQSPGWEVEARVYRGRENRETELMEGEESSLKKLPCVILSCTGAQAVLQNFKLSGLWTGRLDINVWHNRSRTTGDDADEMARNVFDLFLTTSIIPDLSNAIAGFSVRDVIPQDQSLQAQGRAWLTQMSFSMEQVSGT